MGGGRGSSGDTSSIVLGTISKLLGLALQVMVGSYSKGEIMEAHLEGEMNIAPYSPGTPATVSRKMILVSHFLSSRVPNTFPQE